MRGRSFTPSAPPSPGPAPESAIRNCGGDTLRSSTRTSPGEMLCGFLICSWFIRQISGRCPRARPERVAPAIAYCGFRRRPRAWGRRRSEASATHLHSALDVGGDTRHFAQGDRAVSDATIDHRGGRPRQGAADHRYGRKSGQLRRRQCGLCERFWWLRRARLADLSRRATAGRPGQPEDSGFRSGEPATVQIVDSKKEISAGDRLIPAPPLTIPQYVPHAPSSAVRGRIIGLYDALATSVGGRDSIISINRGRRDGLEVGHVLAVYRNVVVYDQSDYLKSRDRSPVIQLPPERYGLAFVFRTFDSVSYALVMESSRPVQGGDIEQNP